MLGPLRLLSDLTRGRTKTVRAKVCLVHSEDSLLPCRLKFLTSQKDLHLDYSLDAVLLQENKKGGGGGHMNKRTH